MNEMMVRAKALFAVRDAIREHLGEEGARMLGVQVASCSWGDGIEVSTRDAGFVISGRALTSELWREVLGFNLNLLVERPT